MAYYWQQVTMEFVETPVFTKLVLDLFSDDEYRELQARLAQYPDSGVVIQDASGLRKIRWAAKGQGKRGGVRVIYYFHSERIPLFLLTVYAKNQKANLTKAERNEFKKLVPILLRTYAKGRKL